MEPGGSEARRQASDAIRSAQAGSALGNCVRSAWMSSVNWHLKLVADLAHLDGTADGTRRPTSTTAWGRSDLPYAS